MAQTVADLSPRKTPFDQGPVNAWYIVDEVAAGQILVPVFLFLLPVLFHNTLILVVMLLLPEGEPREPWKLSNKTTFRKLAHRKEWSFIHTSKGQRGYIKTRFSFQINTFTVVKMTEANVLWVKYSIK